MTNPYPTRSAGVPDSSMSTGAPGLMPRRDSYVQVASGRVSSTGHSYQQPARSGTLPHLLSQSNDHAFDTNDQVHIGSSRYDPPSLAMDVHRNGGSQSSANSWRRQGRFPTFSSQFLPFTTEYGYGRMDGRADFFIPSYLRGSRHVQKLEEAYRTKIATKKDSASAMSSHVGSLSKSASSASLHTNLAPSHRGMAYDLIEKHLNDDGLAPLPSKWNPQDKHVALEVQEDGQEVKYTGNRITGEREHGSSAIRTDHPIPPQCGIYYFEVTIMSRKREESSVCIGFSTKDVMLSRPPGWEPESWGYHGDDGHSYGCHHSGKPYATPYNEKDIIGCGINFRTGCAFFTKNGNNLGTAFRDIKGRLYPSVGMKKPGDHISANFGQSPFFFDIDGMVLTTKTRVHLSLSIGNLFLSSLLTAKDPFSVVDMKKYANVQLQEEKLQLKKQIESTSTAKLAPPLDETSLIQSLILQFLSHDDFVETAKAFAEEVHEERMALTIDPQKATAAFDFVKEDEDAINRQRIRMAILDGDVEKALKHTNAYYPSVLKDNEPIYFHLRSRRFIEMIRQAAEIRAMTMNNKRSNGHSGDWFDDVINNQMELDDTPTASEEWDRMDTGGLHDNQADYIQLLDETIKYGQLLQAEFEHDPRREVQKSLQDAFALLAYEDPVNSKEVSHLLHDDGRVALAEELNSAILVSLGKSSFAALERVIQQTSVLIDDLRESGGPGTLININDYLKPVQGRW